MTGFVLYNPKSFHDLVRTVLGFEPNVLSIKYFLYNNPKCVTHN